MLDHYPTCVELRKKIPKSNLPFNENLGLNTISLAMLFEQISFTTYPSAEDKLRVFVENYGYPMVFMPGDAPIRNRIPRNERICRFCGKAMPEVKFKSDPHIIPRLLGNNYGISDHECDNCNNHFSKYETNFADYLGIQRTITSVGRKKITTFTSPQKALIASQTGRNENSVFLTISDENGENFHFDQAHRAWEIRYTKNSYIPTKVYQALLKIAFGVLPEEELNNYDRLKNFILLDKDQENFSQCAKVWQSTTDHHVERPYCILFKKLRADIQKPMHMAYLCFENFSYQFFLPFHISDKSVYSQANTEIIFTPPLLFDPALKTGKFNVEQLDLSSNQKRIGEQGYIRFSADESLFTHSYDLNTKEFKEDHSMPENIKKIILSTGDKPIDLEELAVNFKTEQGDIRGFK